MADGFGKVFAGLYEGSMIGAGLSVFAVWPYCLARADAQGFVEVNPRLAAHVLGCSIPEVEAALDYLQRPDPESRSQEEEGRRLVREGQFLYRIVNYSHYRELRDQESRREYQREWVREKRASRRESTRVDSRHQSTMSTKAEAEAEAEAEKKRESPSAPRPAKAGPSPSDLAEVWNANRGDLPAVSKVEPKGTRYRQAKARLSDTPDLDRWAAAIRRLAASSFGRGLNDRGWRADFDFLVRPDTLAKIEEGKFDDRRPALKLLPGQHAPKETPAPRTARATPPPTPEGAANVWPTLLPDLAAVVDDERSVDTWLRSLRQAGPLNGSLVLVAPTVGAATLVRDEYLPAIVDVAREHGIDVPIRLFAEDGEEVAA